MRKTITCLAVAATLAAAVGLAGPAGATTAKSTATIKASKHATITGKTITFTGAVTPHNKTRTVHLQQLTKHRWSSIVTTHTNAKGNYTARWVDTRTGISYYRITVAATQSASAVTSAKTHVHARRWRYLSNIDSVASQCEDCYTGTFEINGHNYRNTIADEDASESGQTDFFEYNLGRKCITFTGELGTDDNYDDSSGNVNLEVGVDGQTLFNQNFGLGQSARVTEDITGHLRLKISATGNNNVNDAGDFGSAKILCG